MTSSFYNFTYTPSPASDISGSGSFLTSGLGTTVNPVFGGGTLTGAATGTSAQNFTVTNAAGSTINANGNALTFSGNFTNATSGTPGSLTVTGGGSVTFTGSFGTLSDQFGTLTNSGTTTIGGTGTSYFGAIVNSGTFNILQGATVIDDLTNTGAFNNAGNYTAAVNNSTAGGVITNQSTGVWNGNVLSNTTGASITNNGSWTGTLNSTAIVNNNAGATWNGAFTLGTGSVTTNAGTWTVGSATTSSITNGEFTNNGTMNTGRIQVFGANGVFTNTSTGTVTIGGGNPLEAFTNAQIINNGVVNGVGGSGSGGSIANNAGASWNGAIFVNAGGSLTNAGSVTGLITNNGVVTSTGSFTGGLSNNTGTTANLAGTANGAVNNSGLITVTGALTGNNTFSNSGAGQLLVSGGNYTGLTTITNSSTAATGISVSAGRTLGGTTITNNAGATIVSAGTLSTTSGITNSGTLTSTGAIVGALTNNGVANLAGTFSFNLINQGAGAMTITGNLAGAGGGFSSSGTSTTTVSSGATWSGVFNVVNASTSANGMVVDGTLNANGTFFTQAGATSRVSSTGVVTAISGLQVISGGTLNNSGRISSLVSNAGTLTSNNQLTAGLSNGSSGTASISGVLNSSVSNAGTLTIVGNTTSTGSFVSSLSSVTTVNAGATWSGLTSLTNGSTAATGLQINGALSLAAGATFTGATGSTTRVGTTGSLTLSDPAAQRLITLNGTAQFINDGVVTGGVINNGAVTNNGTWTGAYTGNVAASSLVNNGSWDASSANWFFFTTGSIVNNGTAVGARGRAFGASAVFTNNGTYTQTTLLNFNTEATDGGLIQNNGTITAAIDATSASAAVSRIINAGTINGAVRLLANATATNQAGATLNGTVSVATGTALTNAGAVTGLVTNAGSVTSTGALNGGLTNTGAAQLAGTANGAIANNGTGALTVTGALSSTGALVNQGTGTVIVNAGAEWTGLTSVANTSTAASGLTVNGILTTAGDVSNAAGSTVTVNNGGTLNAGSVTNAEGGTITVAQGGTVNDDLTNNGVVSNAGAYNADVSNSGAAAVIANQATGVWTGDLLANAAGAVTVNDGQWIGAARNESALQNSTGATWTGDLTNLATATNGGVWAGAVTNSGQLLNAATGSVTGLVTNTGLTENAGSMTGGLANTGGVTVSTGLISGGVTNSAQLQASGAVNGAVANQGTGTFIVEGALTGDGAFTNSGDAVLNVANGDFTGLASVSNTSAAVVGVRVAAGRLLSAGTLTNGAGATLLNEGVLTTTGGVSNSGLLVSSGAVNGGLTNGGAGRVEASGAVNGAIVNQGSGVFLVTGALTGNGALTNSGTALLAVQDGNLTGLTSVTNTSTRSQGVIVSVGRLLSAGSLNNGAGATLVNAGTLTTTSGASNSGIFATSGTVNGGLSNTASGEVQARGALNGAVANAGLFFVTGALTGSGAAFDNGATGQLINLASTYGGLGAISNAAGGRIILGDGVSTSLLSGVSLANAGSVEMMNGRVGDRVQLSGAYVGTAGSRLSVDVDMSVDTNQSDRIIAGSATGTTIVSIQNVGSGRILFNQPIVLVSGVTTGATFTAANDAPTQAALARNGLIEYSLRSLDGGAGWGIVASANTGRGGAIAADTLAFTTLADLAVAQSGRDLVAGDAGDGLWSRRVWAAYATGSQEVSPETTTTDRFAQAGPVPSDLLSQTVRFGGTLRVFAGAGGDLDLGVVAGVSDGKVQQEATGLATRFEMPMAGVHAVFTGSRFRADIQVQHLDLEIDPADEIASGQIDGSGQRLMLGLSLPMTWSALSVEPYLQADRLSVDIDAANAAGGGALVFDTQETDRFALGFAAHTAITGQTWTLTPSLDLSATHEDGAAGTRLVAPGGSQVQIGAPRDGVYWDAQAGLNLVHNATGLELYAQGAGRVGDDASGGAVNLGARLRF